MRVASITVRNYRSITDAYKVPLGDLAVLVGPNNEGKSNILRAIGTGLTLLTRPRVRRTGRYSVRYRYAEDQAFDFQWERDFPAALQGSTPDGKSHFTLEFQLDSKERAALNKLTHGNLSSDLKLKLSLGREGADLDVLIQGPAKQVYAKKLSDIAQFVAERIEIQYVPAVRPSDMATKVVEHILTQELCILTQDENYRKLLKQIEDLQKPVLVQLAKELTSAVAAFVPEVRSITLEMPQVLRQGSPRYCTIIVDDGTRTPLSMKGDGTKSLTAISLLRRFGERALGQRALILAIEEPESHLHPRAVHKLREVLYEIAASHQVIISTHSPILVDRARLARNIIVQGGRAAPARRINDLRSALGVEMQDNLTSAYLVLIVEGECDALILRTWLSALSPAVKAGFDNGILVTDHMCGATNLRYTVGLYKNQLCNVHAFLDNDSPGRQSAKMAQDGGALDAKEITHAICRGMPDSEIEDFVAEETYAGDLQTTFGVSLASKYMHTDKKKWSDRVRDCFEAGGKLWNKRTEMEAKGIVAQAVKKSGLAALNEHRRDPIDALAAAILERISKR